MFEKFIYLSALAVLFVAGKAHAQSAGATKDEAEAPGMKYLKGLRKLNSYQEAKYADSVLEEKGFSEYDIQYLSEDYKKVSTSEFKNLMEYSDYKWSADYYVDSNFIVRTKVLRPSTPEDRERAIEELRKLVNAKTPQSIERDKVIASQMNKPAPLFSVVDVDSVKYDLRQLKGKVVVLNFWFIGCAPCRKEMPELNKIAEKYKGKDVVFLAFEVNDNSPGKIKAVAKDFHYTHIPSTRDEKDVASRYKVKTYPTSYVIDQSGIVRFGLAAYNPFKLTDMDKTIEELLNKPMPVKIINSRK